MAPKSRIQKLRNAQLKRSNSGIDSGIRSSYPAYNKLACEFFQTFDQRHNTKGRYAVYGGGEFHIKELKYFVDYINFDLCIIMEWDEDQHYGEGGDLKERDVKRQREIQALYPDFKFIRIKERDIFKGVTNVISK